MNGRVKICCNRVDLRSYYSFMISRRATSADASLVIADSKFWRVSGEFTSELSSRFRLIAMIVADGDNKFRDRGDSAKSLRNENNIFWGEY